MLSEVDIKDLVYRYLVSANLDDTVSGGIYKDARPMNSMLEDVEITVLTSSIAQNQTFIVNVNVFVPDVIRGDEYIEDTPRLRTLSSAFMTKLLDFNEIGYFIQCESQRIYKVNDTDFHVINNRINIKFNSE